MKPISRNEIPPPMDETAGGDAGYRVLASPEQIAAGGLAGVRADVAASVEIGAVYGGYFNAEEPARVFEERGVSVALPDLPQHVRFADFGGGDGFLADRVREHLNQQGKTSRGVVVDMNPKYLQRARERGLDTIEAALETATLEPQDLIVARAVLHYNSQPVQRQIVAHARDSLTPGGFFVHSMSSGDRYNCELRTQIAALPSLGRIASKDAMQFLTPGDYLDMCSELHFPTQYVGDAPGNHWTLSQMYERFNPLKDGQDRDPQKRAQFMHEGFALIGQYATRTLIEGVELLDGDARVSYTYPIFVSRRPMHT